MKDKHEENFEEWLERVEVKGFLRRAERELFPKVKECASNLMIYSGGWDIKLALELGVSILLDKPIILLAIKGAAIPRSLRRIATRIVEVVDINEPGAKEKIQQAIMEVIGDQR